MIETLINENLDKDAKPIDNKPKLKMYPNRPTEGLEEPIEAIKFLLESADKSQLKETQQLSQENKQKLFKFEEQLFDKLKPAYDLKVELHTFYPEYFLTPEGKKNWEEIFGKPMEFDNENDIKKYLIINRKRLGKMALKERGVEDSQRKKSIEYANKKPIKILTDSIVKDGPEIGELPYEKIKDLKYPERTSVISDLKSLLKKISDYFDLRNLLLTEIDRLDKEFDNLNHQVKKNIFSPEMKLIKANLQLNRAKSTIAEIYHKKINVLLAEQYEYGVALQLIQKEDKLSGAEKRILKYFCGLNKPERNLARIDKYKHGRVIEKPQQIGLNISKFADEHRIVYQENEMKKIGNSKIFLEGKNGFQVEVFEKLANELLEKLGLRTNDNERKIPNKEKANDDKWRITVDEARTSMSIDKKAKNIILDKKGRSEYSTFCTMMAHEFIHVFQNIMREELKDILNLKIISEIGGDRSSIFSEAGAKMMEDKMSQELFGLKNLPHPHYLAAMQARLAGENYFGCVKAFYDSALKTNKYVMEQRIIKGDDRKQVIADFQEKNIKDMKDAISRVKRLFRPNVVSLNSKDPYLTSSKDMVYLEQLQLVEKLAENKMEFLTLIGGLNLENIALLIKIGLITPDTMKKLQKKTEEMQTKLFNNIKEIYNEFVIEETKKKIVNIPMNA